VSDEGNGESLLLAARGGHLAMVKCLVYRGVEASTILSDEEVLAVCSVLSFLCLIHTSWLSVYL
jgi:hypothetical protein